MRILRFAQSNKKVEIVLQQLETILIYNTKDSRASYTSNKKALKKLKKLNVQYLRKILKKYF